ncbi:Hsp20/alpha crystallin family protein [Planctomicrobium piriforme]|uniref:Hsp20/alpha crystallin family protein n=1 Tax=Planctomicrobium piriforme TaxID=1576369 RepID=A0A1I3QVT7_9PLAN|nr:Hsp20/alpha crystallin family protein [Planctomicrobium piriforme]SFJ37217.1 Hsp20/alpha crystallin family protein [Planctomicrobium piriforme]
MVTANRVQRLLNSLPRSPWEALLQDFQVLPGSLPSVSAASSLQPRFWVSDAGVVIELDLPGRSAESFDINVERDLLSIGFKSDEQPQSNATWRLRERDVATQTAEFRLPFAIDPNLAETTYSNGVLRFSIQKPAEVQPQKLCVKQG